MWVLGDSDCHGEHLGEALGGTEMGRIGFLAESRRVRFGEHL